MNSLVRLCLTALLTVSAALVLAAPSAAHAALVSSEPADQASLPASPPRVTATFNEAMQPQFAAMTVIGPDGSQWNDGDAEVRGAALGIAVRPGGPAGVYTVNYRATSADGHVVSGAWSYTLTESGPASATTTAASAQTPVPATAPPAAAPSAPTDDGMPVWPFVVGATVIVAGGAVWAVRRRS